MYIKNKFGYLKNKIMKTEIKIMFICHGNVGRSQIAEGYYNYLTETSNASSAGVNPNAPMEWKQLPPKILQVMREENIDLSLKVVKLVTEKMVEESDKIVVLCKKESCPDYLLKHHSIDFWEINDPRDVSIEGLYLIRDGIKHQILKRLLKQEKK